MGLMCVGALEEQIQVPRIDSRRHTGVSEKVAWECQVMVFMCVGAIELGSTIGQATPVLYTTPIPYD
jgi:hypothetical protein